MLYTPPVGASVLPGITRDSVVTLAQDLGYQVKEQDLPREMLYIADELFFTGTAAEITPIRSVDRIQIGPGRRGPVTTDPAERVLRLRQRRGAGSSQLADAGRDPVAPGRGHGRWSEIVGRRRAARRTRQDSPCSAGAS